MTFDEWQTMSATPSSNLHAGRTDAHFGRPELKGYGHAVDDHGAKRAAEEMLDRARTTNRPQGKWLDDELIVQAELRAPATPGEHMVNMGKPVGNVYLPNGEILRDVQIVKVIRKSDGTLKTAYPFA